jgi:hypothetical protein
MDGKVFHEEIATVVAVHSHPSLLTKASEQQQQQQYTDGVHPDVFSNTQVIHTWAKIKSIHPCIL